MWNSENPLKIYLAMSETITESDLKNLQAVINVDKELDNRRNCRNVCGDYAPFCEYCDKNVKYPCAEAYIKMRKNDFSGLSAENVINAETESEECTEETQPLEQINETVCDVVNLEEVDEPVEESEEQVLSQPEESTAKVIRIAHIKRIR